MASRAQGTEFSLWVATELWSNWGECPQDQATLQATAMLAWQLLGCQDRAQTDAPQHGPSHMACPSSSHFSTSAKVWGSCEGTSFHAGRARPSGLGTAGWSSRVLATSSGSLGLEGASLGRQWGPRFGHVQPEIQPHQTPDMARQLIAGPRDRRHLWACS